MEFIVTTKSGPLPLEVLDLSIQNRREAGQSRLSLRFECRLGRERDHLRLPLLTWFEANQLQQFMQHLLGAGPVDTHQVELSGAGLRLTGGGWHANNPTIRVESLAGARTGTPTVSINGNRRSLNRYAQLLSQRLWEAFCRG